MSILARFRIAVYWNLSVLMIGLGMIPAAAEDDSNQELEYFEKHVRPLLIQRCQECHGADSDSVGGNLRLDSRRGWVSGGELGPAIIPGDPAESLLIAAVRHQAGDLQMPPDGKLSEAEIQHLENWIRRGAFDPRVANQSPPGGDSAIDLSVASDHWAFRPLADVSPPLCSSWLTSWAKNQIDAFVAQKYVDKGLVPVPRADRRTLIRRVTLDLIGVPPHPAEVEAFVADRRPGAYERLVDRLLASPQYGERWGRHWLDVVRYADSNGLDENAAHGNAWRFRDYVIDAFNRDLSYDRMVREQIAGDRLDAADAADRRRMTVATGMLVLGPKVLAEGDQTKMKMDIIDEQIDTIGRALMGLTLGCARCHDHKFDPISTRDYYALAGILGSTKTMEDYKRIAKWNEVPIATESQQTQRAAQQQAIEDANQRLQQLITAANEELLATLEPGAKLPDDPQPHYDSATQARLTKLRRQVTEAETALIQLPAAMAVTDQPQPADQAVLIRGNHLTPADPVARGFPRVLVADHDDDRFTIPADQSGRVQLAQWLTSDDHPLVSRVIVNRIWRWHFGRGITPSTDNFGLLGDHPSHPELLDWLAGTLIRDGWSIKQLHRRILLSATYQLASTRHPENQRLDPGNDSLWRFRVRRMEAEELLDSLHQVSGLLDRRMGGSLLKTENRVLVFNHTSEDHTTYEHPRRAVYLPVIRNHLADVFQLFDYSDASVMTGDRSSTTIAPQALFMMNSETVHRAANHFADRVMRAGGANDRQRVDLAYQIAFGRPASDQELVRGREFVAMLAEPNGRQDDARRRAWRTLCHTLLSANEFCYIR